MRRAAELRCAGGTDDLETTGALARLHMLAASPILNTVEALYGAVLAPARWPAVLDDLVTCLKGDHAVLYAPDSDACPLSVTARIESANAARLCSPDAARMLRPLFRRAPVGEPFVSTDLFRDEEFARTPVYNELVRPAGGFYSIHGLLGSGASLAVCRPRRMGAFGQSEARRLGAVLPHLTLALELRQRMRLAQEVSDGWVKLLDRLAMSVVLTDAGARICHANARCLQLLEEADGFAIRDGKVVAATPPLSLRLHETIASSIVPDGSGSVESSTGTRGRRFPLQLRLTRPSARPDLLVTVLPVWHLDISIADRHARVALFITEPSAPAPINHEALAETFGLTQRETTVAILLASGLSVRDIAAKLDIGVGTVRNHMKSALAKTSTHSQAKLVAMLRGFTGVLQ